MKTSTFIIPAVFTFAASLAMGQDYKEFDEVDTDSDGELSTQELRAALPGLQTMMMTDRSTTGSQEPATTGSRAGANAGASSSQGAGASAGANTMITRQDIARALPGIEFDEETGPIDEDAYDKIVEELEERNIDATTSSPAGATGAANQSARGAAASSTNSNSPRTTQSSPSQEPRSTQGSQSQEPRATQARPSQGPVTEPDRNPNPTRPQTGQ